MNTNEFGFIFLMQFGFMFIALIWKFDFSPFMVLIIAILNDGKVLNLYFYKIYLEISFYKLCCMKMM